MRNGAARASGIASGIAPSVAVALGGGSARGLAHIVVLEALDELGIKPAAIAGTSMGAICGALYAAGMPAAEMRAAFTREFASPAAFVRRHTVRLAAGLPSLWGPRRPGVVDVAALLDMLLPDILRCEFAALGVPFMAVAADLHANDQVVLDRGPLIPAVAASCALPAWARPVVIDGRALIDGGYVNPVPFDVVMDKADVTIAVDVTGDPRLGAAPVPRPLAARRGAVQMMFHAIVREKLRTRPPDILIRPAVGGVGSVDFFRIGAILAAAEPSRDEVKRRLAQCLERTA